MAIYCEHRNCSVCWCLCAILFSHTDAFMRVVFVNAQHIRRINQNMNKHRGKSASAISDNNEYRLFLLSHTHTEQKCRPWNDCFAWQPVFAHRFLPIYDGIIVAVSFCSDVRVCACVCVYVVFFSQLSVAHRPGNTSPLLF